MAALPATNEIGTVVRLTKAFMRSRGLFVDGRQQKPPETRGSASMADVAYSTCLNRGLDQLRNGMERTLAVADSQAEAMLLTLVGRGREKNRCGSCRKRFSILGLGLIGGTERL